MFSNIKNVCIFNIMVYISLLYINVGSMHISLTPELEIKVKQKVASGFYNNASYFDFETPFLVWEKQI